MPLGRLRAVLPVSNTVATPLNTTDGGMPHRVGVPTTNRQPASSNQSRATKRQETRPCERGIGLLGRADSGPERRPNVGYRRECSKDYRYTSHRRTKGRSTLEFKRSAPTHPKASRVGNWDCCACTFSGGRHRGGRFVEGLEHV